MTISVDLKDSEQARWARTIANTWTVSRINIDKWSSLTKVLMEMVSKEDYTGTGAWNDAGILNLNLPTSEFLVQLGLWMGLKAPIWFPAPLDNLNTTKLSYFLNDELVSLSQDPLRKPVILLRHDEFAQGVQEVWGGWLTSNRFVLLFMNGLSTAAPMNISLTKEAKIPDLFSYSIRDPVMRRNIGSSSNEEVRVASVAGHSLEIRVLHF